MGCKVCEEKLLEFLYGELKGADAAKMEEHLAASEPCRQVYRNFKATVDLLALQGEEPAPEQMYTRIMAHAEELADRAKARSWRWSLLFRPALATAMVGVIAAGVYLYSLRNKGTLETNIPPVVSEFPAKAFRESRPVSEEGDRPIEHRELAKEKQEKSSADQSKGPAGPLRATARDEMLTGEVAGRGGAALTEPPRRAGEAKPALQGDAETVARSPAVSMTAPAGVEGPALKEFAEIAPRAAAQLPTALQEALVAAREGRCSEALPLVEDFADRFPSDESCGLVWLDLGRCFLREGDPEQARETASKALASPSHAEEAKIFLRSLQADGR